MKVEFHSGVADKLAAVRRFLHKAHTAGAMVVVCGEPAQLDRLDVMLWTADAHSFLPHLRVRVTAPPPAMARTPVWLADDPALVAPRDLLVNLGPNVVAGWEAFERIVEIVSGDADDAEAGRLRWRHYAAHGGAELLHVSRGVAR